MILPLALKRTKQSQSGATRVGESYCSVKPMAIAWPPLGEPGVGPTIELFSPTPHQFPIDGSFQLHGSGLRRVEAAENKPDKRRDAEGAENRGEKADFSCIIIVAFFGKKKARRKSAFSESLRFSRKVPTAALS